MFDLIGIAQAAGQALAETAGETSSEGTLGGIVGTLGINWKLFVAQLINFAVLLFVLWKWVFTPVAKKLTERTQKIEQSLKDAKRIEQEKQDFSQWREEELSKAKKQAAEIVSRASQEAQKVKDEMLRQTKLEQEHLVLQTKQQIESEKQKALAEAKSQIASVVALATEKILRKKLDEKEDRRLIHESLESIK